MSSYIFLVITLIIMTQADRFHGQIIIIQNAADDTIYIDNTDREYYYAIDIY